jgi:hypothetical protein
MKHTAAAGRARTVCGYHLSVEGERRAPRRAARAAGASGAGPRGRARGAAGAGLLRGCLSGTERENRVRARNYGTNPTQTSPSQKRLQRTRATVRSAFAVRRRGAGRRPRRERAPPRQSSRSARPWRGPADGRRPHLSRRPRAAGCRCRSSGRRRARRGRAPAAPVPSCAPTGAARGGPPRPPPPPPPPPRDCPLTRSTRSSWAAPPARCRARCRPAAAAPARPPWAASARSPRTAR